MVLVFLGKMSHSQAAGGFLIIESHLPSLIEVPEELLSSSTSRIVPK